MKHLSISDSISHGFTHLHPSPGHRLCGWPGERPGPECQGARREPRGSTGRNGEEHFFHESGGGVAGDAGGKPPTSLFRGLPQDQILKEEGIRRSTVEPCAWHMFGPIRSVLVQVFFFAPPAPPAPGRCAVLLRVRAPKAGQPFL